VDLVEHHRNGGSGHEGKTFRYVDADGRPGRGRFPKNQPNFHGGGIPRDPKVLQDLSFGSSLRVPPHLGGVSAPGALRGGRGWVGGQPADNRRDAIQVDSYEVDTMGREVIVDWRPPG
jgi:hypothetical protein